MRENPLSCVSKASDTWLSPDQTIRLEFLVNEWAPSLWTHTPRVTEVATGAVLLDLWGTSWDARTAWVGASGLRLDLRRYDRPGTITLLLDIAGGSYRIAESGGTARPLVDVRRGMKEAFEAEHQRYLESLTTPAGTNADRAEQDKPSKNTDNRVTLVRVLLRALMFGR